MCKLKGYYDQLNELDDNTKTLFEKSKKGEVDFLSLNPDTLKLFCELISIEIELKEAENLEKKKRLTEFERILEKKE